MEDYKVGDLAMYLISTSGMIPERTLVLIKEIDEEQGYYNIVFLDDGSDMNVIHSELSPVEVS